MYHSMTDDINVAWLDDDFRFRSKESLAYGQLPLTVIPISTFPAAKRRLQLLLSAPPSPGVPSNQSRLPKAAAREPPALPPRTHKDSSFGCSIPRSELRFSWLVHSLRPWPVMQVLAQMRLPSSCSSGPCRSNLTTVIEPAGISSASTSSASSMPNRSQRTIRVRCLVRHHQDIPRRFFR